MLRIHGLILWTLALGLMALPAAGKPMPAPSMEEGVSQATAIVIGRYKGYQASEAIDYFQGPIARYRVERILKGAVPSEPIRVHYDFHDGSACLPEANWRFNPAAQMPATGSRWILLLQADAGRLYRTYRGSYGRLPATEENLRRVQALLQ